MKSWFKKKGSKVSEKFADGTWSTLTRSFSFSEETIGSLYDLSGIVIAGVYMSGRHPKDTKGLINFNGLLKSNKNKLKNNIKRSRKKIELANQEVILSDLPFGAWKHTLLLEAVRINMRVVPEDLHLFVINNIDVPCLKEMALWDLAPSLEITQAIQSKFKKLKDLKILYKLPKFDGIQAIPTIKSLETVFIAFAEICQENDVRMSFPSPRELPNLKLLDIGDILLQRPWHANPYVMGPHIKELRLTRDHPPRFLTYNFPNIRHLTYTLEVGHITAYESIAHFKSLKSLVLSDQSSDKLKDYPEIKSNSVASLILTYVGCIDASFWSWLMKSFPNLVYLNIDSSNFSKIDFPATCVNALPRLNKFICPAKFPADFLFRFKRFAPNAKHFLRDYD